VVDLNAQFDGDMDRVFMNTAEFAEGVVIQDTAGVNASVTAQFDFQIGAVDGKERAIFRVKDSVDAERNYYVTFNSERWIIVDVRPDDLGMKELKCDRPEVTA
jgi:hypothetical protein